MDHSFTASIKTIICSLNGKHYLYCCVSCCKHCMVNKNCILSCSKLFYLLFFEMLINKHSQQEPEQLLDGAVKNYDNTFLKAVRPGQYQILMGKTNF